MNALQIIEAEDPKAFLRQVSQSKAGDIWPSDNYFLNLTALGKSFKDGEFCPIVVRPGNDATNMDAFYGLLDDIANALGHGDNLSPRQEEAEHEAYDSYVQPLWDAIKKGITRGTVNGVAGTKKWRIVYYPNHRQQNWGQWTDEQEVVAGKRYGPRMAEEALELAGRVIEGEDPKSFFRQVAQQRPCVHIVAEEHWMPKPKFEVTFPLYLNRFYRYEWDDRATTEEQAAFLEEHHESIFTNLNEGERRGKLTTIDCEGGDFEAVPVGHWDVVGNLDLLHDEEPHLDSPAD